MNRANHSSAVGRRHLDSRQLRSTWNTYAFWRPILFAIGISAVVVVVCTQLLAWQPESDLPQSELLSLVYPHAGIAPEEVVAIQVDAMMEQDRPGLGAFQCYCFAAPMNRVVTGPFRRFAEMIRMPPFDEIGECSSYSVGTGKKLEEDQMRFLVSVVGEHGTVRLFVWVVERIEDGPFDDCWMTNGVFLVGPTDGRENEQVDEFDNLSANPKEKSTEKVPPRPSKCRSFGNTQHLSICALRNYNSQINIQTNHSAILAGRLRNG